MRYCVQTKLRNYKYNIIVTMKTAKIIIIIILIFLIKGSYKRFYSDIKLIINTCVIKLKIINDYNYTYATTTLTLLN